jgi:hypothetical protein
MIFYPAVGQPLSNQLWEDGRVKNGKHRDLKTLNLELRTSNFERGTAEDRMQNVKLKIKDAETGQHGPGRVAWGRSKSAIFWRKSMVFGRRAQAQMFVFVRVCPHYFTIHVVGRWRGFLEAAKWRLAGFVPACPRRKWLISRGAMFLSHVASG